MYRNLHFLHPEHQTVLLRTDYNVPLKNGIIENNLRIEKSLPTIQYLLDHQVKKLVIISHLGRPEGKVVPEFSLRPVAAELSHLLRREVLFAPETTGEATKQLISEAPEGTVILLENLRFYPGEEENSIDFAQAIFDTVQPDCFVQDGFGVLHRAHASTDALPRLLPSAMGLLVEQEIENLKKVQEIFPNTVIQEKGLLATEGFISFPDTEKNLSKLSFYSHFFEFLSLDDNKIYNISEIETNKKYELILTTSGGLYRYCIGDIIEVISIENNVPYIKFAGRKGAVSDLFGEKLEESFLKNIMETYKQKIDFYMFAPNKNHYILFIKTDRKIDVQDLENKLRENFHYDYCRKLGQLKAIKMFTLTGQPEKEYIQACQNKNQKLGNIKMTALSKESGWENIFNGYFQESEDK